MWQGVVRTDLINSFIRYFKRKKNEGRKKKIKMVGAGGDKKGGGKSPGTHFQNIFYGNHPWVAQIIPRQYGGHLGGWSDKQTFYLIRY